MKADSRVNMPFQTINLYHSLGKFSKQQIGFNTYM